MKDKRIHIRVSDELHDQIKAAAENDGRSITNWLTRIIEQRLEQVMLKDKPLYMVVQSDLQGNEDIYYQGNDLKTAIDDAENLIIRYKQSGEKTDIELRVCHWVDEDNYDWDTIDYPHFSTMTYTDLRDSVQAGECRHEAGQACYFLQAKHDDVEIYVEKRAEEYDEEEPWEKQDEIEDDLIEMAKEKIEALRPEGV